MVEIELPPVPAIASVALFRSTAQAARARLREEFSLDLPAAATYARGADVDAVGTGPESWLLIAEPGTDLVATLRNAVGDLAAIVDLSDRNVMIVLQGRDARAALAKLLPLDLHPRAFPPGGTASTVSAHINVQVWHDVASDGFVILVARSTARCLLHAITAAAAEFGLGSASTLS